MEDQGKSSWKNLIRADIDYAISLSESYEEFLEQMRSMHYQIQEGTSREEGAILSLKLPGQGRACRTQKENIGRSLYGGCHPGADRKRMEILSGTKASKAATLPDAFRTGKTSGGSPDIKPVMSETFTRSRTAMPVEIFMRSIRAVCGNI